MVARYWARLSDGGGHLRPEYCFSTFDNKMIRFITDIDSNHDDIVGYLPEELALLYINLNWFWGIVPHRKTQNEIDQNLKIVPLITLVDDARVRERLEVIEKDQHEYTLDEEDRRMQDVILKPDPSTNDAMILKKTLSCSYPNMCFNEALRKENEKLRLELQLSQANYDVQQCEVIQRLLHVTGCGYNFYSI
ncbi:cell number regulator 13-like [Hibiscus syriacus]|uniref:cell number regulator 13-like n=1 Tax=Hibiscus syriacus TaxID=106335 RepID=UPI0019208C76|nr:cell number regulator 13-like [Hibiscus syriacus]